MKKEGEGNKKSRRNRKERKGNGMDKEEIKRK